MSNKPRNTATFKHIQQKYGQSNQSFSLPELQDSLALDEINIPERTLRRWLNQWINQAQLQKTGQKRGTRYQVINTHLTTKNSPLFLNAVEPAKRPATLAKLRDLWTHSSTALEGNTLNLGDTHAILELGLTISGKPLKEHHEIIGHAKAIDLIYQISTETLTKEHLFDLHKAVQTEAITDIYQPIGAWKVEKNYANSVTSSGEQVTIEYADPKDVDSLMKQLINEINQLDIASITPENAAEHYAAIHLAFVHIHPFADGNGRLSRLIANLPLLKTGLPPLIIDQNKRRKYITLLADYQSSTPIPTAKEIKNLGLWQKNENTYSFINFCSSCYQITIDAIQ